MVGNYKTHKSKEILKLDDELKIAEIKTIWRWEKKKIPPGIKDILAEKQLITLRNRSFIRERDWKQDSISHRLATRANKEISEIQIAKSKKGLVKKFRRKCFLVEYATP